ncbi:MAG: nicotinamide riboside transporter PnuC [Burkholderiales bacterium]
MDLTSPFIATLNTAAFTLWGSPVSWLELVAVVLALWMVGCNMRVRPLAWPLAIISSALYFLVFWHNRLYGDATLQLVFIGVAGWGWWQWLRGTDSLGQPLQVRPAPKQTLAIALGLTLLAWPLLGLLLARTTDTDVPYWDAFPTTGSLLGQWLLGRKHIENWLVWGMVNIVGVGLFAYKGLWLTVGLYGVFVVLSWVGWQAWRRQAAQRQTGVQAA